MKPDVTVLVDTYNHERFIEQALVSVLEQDFPASEMEVLAVDDGSTDRTPEIVRKFAPRVRLLRKTNGGQASAFNFGIPEARGEIVAFLDGDDWWARDKLAHVTAAMAADPAVGIVGHGIVIVHRDGRQEAETLREGFRFRANTIEGAKLLRRRGSLLGTSRMTIRRRLLARIGPIPAEIRVQADEYVFTIAAALSDAKILQQALTYYRLHDLNAFQTSTFNLKRECQKLKSLTVLVQSLDEQLRRHGIEKQVSKAALAYTTAAAERLRLIINGGWSVQTASAEWRLFEVCHPEASFARRILKLLTLLGACAMPPRLYYRIQSWLSQNSSYLRIRRFFLPIPRMPHLIHSVKNSAVQAASSDVDVRS
jgi:glycosyltransferase involved in cell wall biosynthesis